MEDILSTREILRRAFPGITHHEAVEMGAAGTVCVYPTGAVLCHEDTIESTFYVLLDGTVQVTKKIDEKDARLLKTLYPGDFFGEMALIHNSPRAASVTATTEIRVLEVEKDDFRHLLECNNALSLTMVREVSRRLRENDRMAIEDLRVKARELAEAYQQLAEQEIGRSQFLTTIAHELRTPLATSSGFLQVIRSGMLKGDALESALETVTRNLQDIISITNNILFLQEMDLILPEFRSLEIGQVVAEAAQKLQSKASMAEVTFQLELDANTPQVQGDAKSLERALNAVLDNAIKFSDPGATVRVAVAPDLGGAMIQVEDQGVGIPEEALPFIYDRYFHVDRIGDRLFRGAGIGLSIARAVIEQHQGFISVKTALGSGSTFSIYLPARGEKANPAG